MFVQDHRADFDAVLKSRKAFALVRFGDGEQAIIQGKENRSADAWWARGPVWCQNEVLSSLTAGMDAYCVGLPPACCHRTGLGLRAGVSVPKSAQTFSTLFMHGNLPRARELEDRFKDAIIINGEYGTPGYEVPLDGVTEAWDVDGLVEKLLKVTDRPVLFAAGPCSNVIIYRYWRRQQPSLRVPMIDVGSPLDVLRFKINRHYHGKMNDHHCIWHDQSRAPLRQGEGGRHPVEYGGERIRIGRELPTEGATKKVQRSPERRRIGKR